MELSEPPGQPKKRYSPRVRDRGAGEDGIKIIQGVKFKDGVEMIERVA